MKILDNNSKLGLFPNARITLSFRSRSGSRYGAMFFCIARMTLLLSDEIFPLASAKSCNINSATSRHCPGDYTHVAKGNKCLRIAAKGRSHHAFYGDKQCEAKAGKLVMIKSAGENQGVVDFLKDATQRSTGPDDWYFFGMMNGKYIDGTSIGRGSYSNFKPGRQKDCVIIGSITGKWRFTDCGTTHSGAVCETYPEREPQRPKIEAVGLKLTNGKLKVKDGDKLTIKCEGILGEKGRINFVKWYVGNAEIIEELSHLQVQRREAYETRNGRCLRVGYAQMTFYLFRSLEEHTLGCVTKNVSQSFMRCKDKDKDPYCQLLPGTFEFDPLPPGQKQSGPQPDSFPYHEINVPNVSPIPTDPSFWSGKGISQPDRPVGRNITTQQPPYSDFYTRSWWEPLALIIILISFILFLTILLLKYLCAGVKEKEYQGEEQWEFWDANDSITQSNFTFAFNNIGPDGKKVLPTRPKAFSQTLSKTKSLTVSTATTSVKKSVKGRSSVKTGTTATTNDSNKSR